MDCNVLQGDALELLRTLPPESVHTCVTSPPYYNLRDYGVEGQIGNEGSVEEYLQALVAVSVKSGGCCGQMERCG